MGGEAAVGVHKGKPCDTTNAQTLTGKDLWIEKIKPQMKRIACWTLLGAKSSIKDRPNSYEVFGIDYMIDTNFNTWLIEVNKNPALEYSTVFHHP